MHSIPRDVGKGPYALHRAIENVCSFLGIQRKLYAVERQALFIAREIWPDRPVGPSHKALRAEGIAYPPDESIRVAEGERLSRERP